MKIFYLLFGAWLNPEIANWPDIFSAFSRNDSGWYQSIAENGYPTTAPQGYVQSAYAFFPLYPMLMKACMAILPNFNLAAFSFSVILTVFWVYGIWKYLKIQSFAEKDILKFVLFYQVIPFHYFFHMYYSELLFSVLLVFALYFRSKGKGWQSFVMLVLLSLCRPTGIVFAFAFLFYPNRLSVNELNLRSIWNHCWPLLGAIIGILLFQTYAFVKCGDFFANQHAMFAWQRKYVWPWESFFVKSNFEYVVTGWYSVLLLCVLLILVLKKRKFNFGIFAAITALFPLCTGTTDSFYRYFAINFPVFQELYSKFSQRKIIWQWIFYLFLFGFNLISFWYWVAIHGQLSY